MDPGSLAASVVGFVVPFLAKKGQKIASEVGDQVWSAFSKKASQMWEAIRERFSREDEAQPSLQDLEDDPEDSARQAAAQETLARALNTDEEFRKTLIRLVDEVKDLGGDRVIQVFGSGAAATEGGVAAGQGGYAAGGNINIGPSPSPEEKQ